MLNFVKQRLNKRTITSSIAVLFISLQLPIALFASPLASADSTVTPLTPEDTCLDGSIQQNFAVSFPTAGTATIGTANDQPLCNDTSLYFSSYVMPASYDGRGFFPGTPIANPTAYPQTIFDSAAITLPAGYSGSDTYAIDMPETCNNVQVDVYYAPEITTVGPTGHGTQNILSQVYGSTGPCASVTPPQPDAPVVLCHATGNIETPYLKMTVSAAEAAVGNYGDEDSSNASDIIPEFTYDGDTYDALNYSTINQTIYKNECNIPVSAPVVSATGDDNVGRGGGSSDAPNTPAPAPVKVLNLLTPPVVAAPAAVSKPSPAAQLVNTGSNLFLNIFAGLFIIGSAGALVSVPNKRRYS